MHEHEEKISEAQMERHFKSHPELKPGRDYRMEIFHCITEDERDKYRKNFDDVFPNAPGAGI